MKKAFSFIFGGTVGAIAALLLTPRTGEETRAAIAKKADYYADHGEEVLQRGRDIIREKVAETKDEAKPTAEDIKTKINEARDRIAQQVTRDRDAAQPVEAEVSDIKEDISDVAEGIVDEISANPTDTSATTPPTE